jgi:hypothetical protein
MSACFVQLLSATPAENKIIAKRRPTMALNNGDEYGVTRKMFCAFYEFCPWRWLQDKFS